MYKDEFKTLVKQILERGDHDEEDLAARLEDDAAEITKMAIANDLVQFLPEDPNSFPTCWEGEVIDETVSTITVRLSGNANRSDLNGREASIDRSMLCDENTLYHKGDRGELVVHGWVAEDLEWM